MLALLVHHGVEGRRLADGLAAPGRKGAAQQVERDEPEGDARRVRAQQGRGGGPVRAPCLCTRAPVSVAK